MAVYVDDMKAKFGRLIMSHIIADTDEELHAMVDKIGVARKWHQAPPKHDSHYDIAQKMVAKALAAGAIQITLRQCGSMNARRRITGQLGAPEDAEEWLIAYRRKQFADRMDAERAADRAAEAHSRTHGTYQNIGDSFATEYKR